MKTRTEVIVRYLNLKVADLENRIADLEGQRIMDVIDGEVERSNKVKRESEMYWQQISADYEARWGF